MVSIMQKSTAGGALTIIAILLVSTIPLPTGPVITSLPELNSGDVFSDKTTIKQGEDVTIYLSNRILHEAGVVYFLFDFQDEQGVYIIDRQTEADSSVTHTYTTVGKYDVTVLALAPGNASRTFTVPITVQPDPLFINISAKSVAIEGEPIVFSAALGDTLYSQASKFYWEFGDGTTSSTETASITHTYNNTGNYTVRLRVYTTDAIAYTDFFDIEVTNEAPVVAILSNDAGEEDEEIVFSTSILDSAFDQLTYDYIWSFDDGSYSREANPVHRFYDEGIYDVEVKVFDNNGAVGSATKTVSISNVVPQITLSNEIKGYYEGETAITLANVQDSPSDLYTMNYTWNTDADGVQASIPMLDNGLYRFNATVTDDNGASANASTDLINVVNVAPVASLIRAYTSYNVSFEIYGTIGTSVNMTLFKDGVNLANTSLISYSTNYTEANSTFLMQVDQDLIEYADIVYHLNNQSNSYDNYVITTFSFPDSDNVTLISHCQSDKPCSAVTWREPITPLDRGFPVTLEFKYFDPGADDVLLGVDFGSVTVVSELVEVGTANTGSAIVRGAMPYGQNPTSLKYWAQDDEGARSEYRLPLLDQSTVNRTEGIPEALQLRHWGNTISHYAPSAFISLSSSGGFNSTRADNFVYEGARQQFYADPSYISPATLNYEWHMGDGSRPLFAKTPTHSYAYSGEYLVWVKLYDDFYETVAYSWITVENQPQNFEPMITGVFEEGSELSVGVWGLIESQVFTSQYSFIWNFGDGKLEFGPSVTHTYSDNGNYSFSLTVLDEHNVRAVRGFTIPISSQAPWVVTPLQANYSSGVGTNFAINPLVTDASFDREGLQYFWQINGQTFTTASLNVNYPVGSYNGTLNVTDKDGQVFNHEFNLEVEDRPILVTVPIHQLYGRAINSEMVLQGSLSPDVFSQLTYQDETSILFTLYDKSGTPISEGAATYLDGFRFEFEVDLDLLFELEVLDNLADDGRSVVQILEDQPLVISGDYRISLEMVETVSGDSLGMYSTHISYTADQDGDFLTDELEIIFSKTLDTLSLNPLLEDSDLDGISDSVEFLLADDPDQDGIPGILELEMGTDPNNPDTDGDGLQDGWGPNGLGELTHGSDPLNPETDGDGISDGQEVAGWEIVIESSFGFEYTISVSSSPILKDTDGDSIQDNIEFSLGSNPRSQDTDADGLSDDREQSRGTFLNNLDTDGDGLSDYDEVELIFTSRWFDKSNGLITQTHRPNPLAYDTDDDGLNDYEEVHVYGSVTTSADTDQDLVLDRAEIINGTNILDADTDGDFLIDGVEIQGFDIPTVNFSPGQYDADGSTIVPPLQTQSTIRVSTNPLLFDSDGDGLSDYEELFPSPLNLPATSSYLKEKISNPASADSDGDGLSDAIDPYPILPDYTPPTLGTIYYSYDVGPNSILSNLEEVFTKGLEAVWELMKDVGTVVLDILNSIFYMKCALRSVTGSCIVYVPWLRSPSEIAASVREAIVSFATAADSRLKEIFPQYGAVVAPIRNIITFEGFGVSVKTDSDGFPIALDLAGLFKMVTTSFLKQVDQFVDPTVNVEFVVVDDIQVDRVEIYQDGVLVQTTDINSKSGKVEGTFDLLVSESGELDTHFQYIVYDEAGNSLVLEDTRSIVNFAEEVVNSFLREVLEVIDLFAPWASDILAVGIEAVETAVAKVIAVARALVNYVLDFALGTILESFKGFVRDIFAAGFDSYKNLAEQKIDYLSGLYSNNRAVVTELIDTGINEIGFAQGSQNVLGEIENFYKLVKPPVNEKALLNEVTGSATWLFGDFLSGTVVKIAMDYLGDEFFVVFEDLITGFLEEIADSLIDQYFGAMVSVVDALIAVAPAIDLGIDTAAGFDKSLSMTLTSVDQVTQKVLNFVELVREPAALLTGAIDQVTGENIMTMVDIFWQSPARLPTSLFDMTKEILTPIVTVGYLLRDVIFNFGDLTPAALPSLSFDEMSQLENNRNLLGVSYDVRDLQTGPLPSGISTDTYEQQVMLSIKMVWKFLESVFDVSLGVLFGLISQDGAPGPELAVEYGFRFLLFSFNLAMDIGFDDSLGKPLTGENNFMGSLGKYVTRGTVQVLKAIHLSLIAGGIFDGYEIYDVTSVVLDFLALAVDFSLTIVEYDVETGKNSAKLTALIFKVLTGILDMAFVIGHKLTDFGLKLAGPAQVVYYGVLFATHLLKFVADLITGIVDMNEANVLPLTTSNLV